MTSSIISRQDLSDYLGRDLTTDAGALIAVNAASDVCRTVAEQTFTEVVGDTVTLDGTGTDAILLPELPVNAAGTVVVNGTTAGTADYALTDGGALVALSGTATWFGSGPYGTWGYWGYPWTGGAALYSGPTWPKGRQNITVTYDHGGSIVPDDVRMVALSFASRFIVQGAAIQESVGDVSVRYAVASTDLTKGEENILRRYKRSR